MPNGWYQCVFLCVSVRGVRAIPGLSAILIRGIQSTACLTMCVCVCMCGSLKSHLVREFPQFKEAEGPDWHISILNPALQLEHSSLVGTSSAICKQICTTAILICKYNRWTRTLKSIGMDSLQESRTKVDYRFRQRKTLSEVQKKLLYCMENPYDIMSKQLCTGKSLSSTTRNPQSLWWYSVV